MKYSLRSLMIVAILAPSALALVVFAVQYAIKNAKVRVINLEDVR